MKFKQILYVISEATSQTAETLYALDKKNPSEYKFADFWELQ